MTAPRTTAGLHSGSCDPSTDEELMDVVGLMLGMTMLNIAVVNPYAEQRIRAFLEEATEQQMAMDHKLAVRAIGAALDRELIRNLMEMIDAGEISAASDLFAGSRAVN